MQNVCGMALLSAVPVMCNPLEAFMYTASKNRWMCVEADV